MHFRTKLFCCFHTHHIICHWHFKLNYCCSLIILLIYHVPFNIICCLLPHYSFDHLWYVKGNNKDMYNDTTFIFKRHLPFNLNWFTPEYLTGVLPLFIRYWLEVNASDALLHSSKMESFSVFSTQTILKCSLPFLWFWETCHSATTNGWV